MSSVCESETTRSEAVVKYLGLCKSKNSGTALSVQLKNISTDKKYWQIRKIMRGNRSSDTWKIVSFAWILWLRGIRAIFILYKNVCELLKIFATVSLFQNVHAASQLGHVNGGFHRNGSVRSAECHPLHAHGGGAGAEQGGGGGGHNHHTLDHSYKVTRAQHSVPHSA